MIEILLALVLVLCLLTVEVLEHSLNSGVTSSAWTSGGLLIPLAFLLGWLMHRRNQARSRSSVTDRASSVPKVVTWGLLLAILLVAATLRLHELGAESLWYDELCTLDLASRPWTESLQKVHPLLFLLTRLVVPLGRSEFVLRFLPAMIGIVSVAALYVLGSTVYGRREGLAAAALFASSVYGIYHGQELRFYGPQMLLATLTLIFMLRGLASHRWQDWGGFALATTLSLYNHPFALFVLASEGLYVLHLSTWDSLLKAEVRSFPLSDRLRAWLRNLVKPSIAAICSLAAYFPQWVHLFQHPKWVNNAGLGMASSLRASGGTWLSNPAAFWIHGLLGEFTSVRPHPLLLYLLLGLFLLGLVTGQKRTVVLALLWVLLPLPVLLLTGIWLYPRYLSYFWAILAIVMAHGLVHLAQAITHHPGRQAVVLALLTILTTVPNMVQLPSYYADPQKDQWRELAALVDAQHQYGDLILFNSTHSLDPLPFDWYSRTPASELARMPFPEDYVLTDTAQLNDLPTIVQGSERVWLVFYHGEAEIETMIESELATTHNLVHELSFEGLRLLLYKTKAQENGP